MSWEAAGRQGVQDLLIAAGELCSLDSFPLETLALLAGKISAGGWRQGRAGIPKILELLESRRGPRLWILPWLLGEVWEEMGEGGAVHCGWETESQALPTTTWCQGTESELISERWVLHLWKRCHFLQILSFWEQESKLRAGSCL